MHPIATEIILVQRNGQATIASLPGVHLPVLPVNSGITVEGTRYRVAHAPSLAIASEGPDAGMVTLQVYVDSGDL